MIRAKELKLYIENTNQFREKIREELRKIDSGKARKLKEDSISFQSLDHLRKFLTPKRLELLRVIRHKKPQSIYGLAKLVERTPENVSTDLKFLERLGLVEVRRVKEIRKKSIPEVGYEKMTLEIPV